MESIQRAQQKHKLAYDWKAVERLSCWGLGAGEVPVGGNRETKEALSALARALSVYILW